MATTFFPPPVTTPVVPVVVVPVALMGPVEMEPGNVAMAIQPGSVVHSFQVGIPALINVLSEGQLTVITTEAVLQPVEGTRARKGMVVGSLTYHDQLGALSTASFRTIDLDGVWYPETGETVTLYQIVNGDPVRLFGGIVNQAKRSHWKKSARPLVTEVSCIGYGGLLERRIARIHYDFTIQWTIFSMVVDLLREFADGTGLNLIGYASSGDQLITTKVTFNYVNLATAIKQLTEPAGLDYQVDSYGGVHIFPVGTGYTPAPFDLDDNSDFVVEPFLQESDSIRANRVFARPSRGLPLLKTETFVADGSQTGFITAYLIEESTKPLIEVNGVVVDPDLIIAYNAYAVPDHLFSYVPGGHGVFSNPANAPYTAGTTVAVTYPHPIPTLPYAEDDVRIAAEGLVETVIEVKDEQDIDALTLAAEGALERFKDRPATLTFKTLQPGFSPGQVFNVNWTQPPFPLFSGDMVITQVTCTEQAKLFWYDIEATNTLWQGEGNATKQWSDIYARSRGVVSHAGEPVNIKIAQTIKGRTNPGTSPGVIEGTHIVQDSGILERLTWIWDSPPTTESIVVDVFLNGVSILGTTKFTYRTVDTGAVTRISFTSFPFYVAKGDQLTATVLSGTDANAKDGTIQANIIR